MNEEENWNQVKMQQTQKKYEGDKIGERIKMKPWSRYLHKAQDGYDSVCSYRSSLPDSPQTTYPWFCTLTTIQIKG